jgi:hypothetical protein
MNKLKDVVSAFQKVDSVIEWYSTTKRTQTSPDMLIEAAKQLNGALYILEKERHLAFEKHTSCILEHIEEGKSKAESETLANREVSELYKYRRLMEAAYRVLDMIRTDISFMKFELSNQA